MKRFLLYMTALLLFAGCSSDNNDNPPVVPPGYVATPPDKSTLNTVLMYMACDNNFIGEIPIKINELKKGWSKDYDGNLLIYADHRTKSYLLHIYSDKNYGFMQADTVAIYAEENSASPEVFGRVMNDVFGSDSEWAATNKGLLTLSHASGWMPKGMLSPSSRSVLHDREGELELWEFAAAIPTRLDYIMFDACLMAGVEVAYELKDKAKYLIASPAEVVVSYEFIYRTLMGRLMRNTPDLTGVTDDFYDDFANSSSPYVTIGLINTDDIDELAEISKEILQQAGVSPYPVTDDPRIYDLQQYWPWNTLYFEFGEYLRMLAPTQELLDDFNQALDKCVIHKKHTPTYFSRLNSWQYKTVPINAEKYSGLTIYIPQSGKTTLNNEYRQRLKWSKYIWN